MNVHYDVYLNENYVEKRHFGKAKNSLLNLQDFDNFINYKPPFNSATKQLKNLFNFCHRCPESMLDSLID